MTTKWIERLRWRIVTVVDKAPGQCWSDLAEWAGRWMSSGDPDERYGLPWRPQPWSCRYDLSNVGSCYCAKLQRDPQGDARTATDPASPASLRGGEEG